MDDQLSRLRQMYERLSPTAQGVVAGVVVGLIAGVVTSILDATVVAGSLPQPHIIGGVAGLFAAFLVWQQGRPVVTEDWSSLSNAPAPRDDTLVRTYRGNPVRSAALFREDAVEMARRGYQPTAQQYVPGSWGCGAFLLALVLAFVIIGILIFLYLIIVKPAGVLTVTYQRRPPAAAPPAPVPTDPAGALETLARLRDGGHITPEEYEAKRVEIVARL